MKLQQSVDPDFVLEKIVDVLPYIDRMVIWFGDKPAFDLKKLESMCAGIKKNKVGFMRYYDKKAGKTRFNHRWKYKLELIQPNKNAIRYLKKMTKCLYMINYVEIALDYIVRTDKDLNEVRNFFERHWVKKWHGKQKIIRKGSEIYSWDSEYGNREATTYYCSRKSSVNCLMYSDRTSKINDKPCCHLEVRISGRAAVKRAQLHEYDAFLGKKFFKNFWEKRLELFSIKDSAYIKKMTMKTLLKEDSAKTDRQRTILQNLWSDMFHIGGGLRTQNFVDHGKGINAKRRFLEKIDNRRFLPRRG
jgi:hypothetical protein